MTESKIKLTIVTEMIKTCVKDNAASTQSQKKYNRLHNGLLNRYEKVVDRLTELTAEKESKRNQDREISGALAPLLMESGGLVFHTGKCATTI